MSLPLCRMKKEQSKHGEMKMSRAMFFALNWNYYISYSYSELFVVGFHFITMRLTFGFLRIREIVKIVTRIFFAGVEKKNFFGLRRTKKTNVFADSKREKKASSSFFSFSFSRCFLSKPKSPSKSSSLMISSKGTRDGWKKKKAFLFSLAATSAAAAASTTTTTPTRATPSAIGVGIFPSQRGNVFLVLSRFYPFSWDSAPRVICLDGTQKAKSVKSRRTNEANAQKPTNTNWSRHNFWQFLRQTKKPFGKLKLFGKIVCASSS